MEGSQEEGAAPREGWPVSWVPLEAREKPLLSLATWRCWPLQRAAHARLLGTVEGTQEARKWRWTQCFLGGGGGGGQSLDGSRSKKVFKGWECLGC